MKTKKTAKNWTTFEEWMRAVDWAAEARIGVSVHDLPDVDYRGMYDDGTSPNTAAILAIRAAKDEGDI